MRDSISEVRQSLNHAVAMLREALRQAARYAENIEALEARLVELERRRAENESFKAKQRLNEPDAKPLLTSPAGDRLVRIKELKQIAGLAASSIYKMMNEGHFPKAVKLSERAVVWRHSDIVAWMKAL